jgi:gliding motility-associated-like protein
LSSNATNFIWSFGNGAAPVTTNSNSNQTTSFNQPGTYTVQLTANNGDCASIFTIPIIVIGYPPLDIHIPNVFTPNDDNSNDEFFIQVSNGASIKVSIFNRWGNQMFEINDFTTKWNGKDASDGVYFFTYDIAGLDGQKLEGHGHVTLLRK